MTVSAAAYGETVHDFVQRHYGPLKCGVKLLAHAADVTIRTAENWLSGLCAPQGAPLLRLMANDPAFRAEIEGLLDQIQERRNAAATASQAFTARHHALLAASRAYTGAPPLPDRRLVPPARNIVTGFGEPLVVSAGYVGVERRRTAR